MISCFFFYFKKGEVKVGKTSYVILDHENGNAIVCDGDAANSLLELLESPITPSKMQPIYYDRQEEKIRFSSHQPAILIHMMRHLAQQRGMKWCALFSAVLRNGYQIYTEERQIIAPQPWPFPDEKDFLATEDRVSFNLLVPKSIIKQIRRYYKTHDVERGRRNKMLGSMLLYGYLYITGKLIVAEEGELNS